MTDKTEAFSKASEIQCLDAMNRSLRRAQAGLKVLWAAACSEGTEIPVSDLPEYAEMLEAEVETALACRRRLDELRQCRRDAPAALGLSREG